MSQIRSIITSDGSNITLDVITYLQFCSKTITGVISTILEGLGTLLLN